MDFFELKAFLTLTKKLHFGKAADEVHLSSSALSRLISRLEDECGTNLFDRNSRDVKLTANGEKFVAFARKTLEDQQDILAYFTKDKDSVSGTLHVYASVTACYTIMQPFIKKLSLAYPAVQLSVETGDPAGAVAAVREGRADLAVAAFSESNSEFFEFTCLKNSPLVFAASISSDYTKIYGSPQDIISEVPLILPKAGLARERFDEWTKSRNVKPKIVAEAEGNEAVMALAALGLGIALVPEIVLENGPYREGFISHSAGNILGYYEIGFIRKKHPSGSENARRIRKAVEEILLQIKQ